MNKQFQDKCIVLVIPSKEFSWHEYETVRNTLEDAGCEIFVTSDNSIEAIADNGNSITIDGGLPIIDVSKYDGLFFIGGNASLTCLNNEQAYRLARDANEMGIPFGAIGLAVRVLAYAKSLVGKAATGLNKDGALEEILEIHGARYRKGADHKQPDFIIDKHVITAHDSNDAQGYAYGILKLLEDDEKGIVKDPLAKQWP